MASARLPFHEGNASVGSDTRQVAAAGQRAVGLGNEAIELNKHVRHMGSWRINPEAWGLHAR